MTDILFTPIRLNELETLIQHSVERGIKAYFEANKEEKKEEEKFLTVQQAAEFLNLTVPTMYSKVSKGELPVMKRGKRLYFSSIQLMEYIKEGSR